VREEKVVILPLAIHSVEDSEGRMVVGERQKRPYSLSVSDSLTHELLLHQRITVEEQTVGPLIQILTLLQLLHELCFSLRLGTMSTRSTNSTFIMSNSTSKTLWHLPI